VGLSPGRRRPSGLARARPQRPLAWDAVVPVKAPPNYCVEATRIDGDLWEVEATAL
jgi:hypothetical protein